MAITTQFGEYARQPSGLWVKTDATTGVKTGPYATADGVTFTLVAGTGSYTGSFSIQGGGYFIDNANGSGPYCTADGSTFKLVT